jgi:hypothetical protein
MRVCQYVSAQARSIPGAESDMADMKPLRREDLGELEDVWTVYDRSMGFVP